MAKLNMDSGHISGLSGVILGTFFSIATSVIGGMILAHIVAWKIAIMLLAAVPVMLLAGFFRLRILAKAQERHETTYNGAAALVSISLNKSQALRGLPSPRWLTRTHADSAPRRHPRHAPRYTQSLHWGKNGTFWTSTEMPSRSHTRRA